MALVCQKVVSQSRNTLRNRALAAKLGVFMLRSRKTPSEMGLWLRKLGVFTLWHFAAVSQLRNEGHYAAKWYSCAKSWFRSCKTPWEMGLWLRNWEFFMLRSCEMRVTVLRNGSRVPKVVSQLRKFSQRGA
uniref:Uncharacterized protein n=1 Tax=Vitis vinifera TaxID=29760 RepID=A5CAM7_VITVI|nr:hypothetical protein VITISV_041894 [Vitis vinifera]